MEFRHILVLAVLFIGADAFAQAYRWVDENGVVHYSDMPGPNAERIDLQSESRPTPPRRTPTARSNDNDAGSQPEAFSYSSVQITTPAAEETLWNIEGVLNVSLAVTPALRPGHQVRVYFDGEPRMVQSLSFQIENVFRGVHNLQVEVLDQNGQMLIRSQTNRFYVQQNSVITAPGAVRPQTAP